MQGALWLGVTGAVVVGVPAVIGGAPGVAAGMTTGAISGYFLGATFGALEGIVIGFGKAMYNNRNQLKWKWLDNDYTARRI